MHGNCFFFLKKREIKMLLKFFLNVKKQIERHFVYMDTCHENEFFACVSFSVFFYCSIPFFASKTHDFLCLFTSFCCMVLPTFLSKKKRVPRANMIFSESTDFQNTGNLMFNSPGGKEIRYEFMTFLLYLLNARYCHLLRLLFFYVEVYALFLSDSMIIIIFFHHYIFFPMKGIR